MNSLLRVYTTLFKRLNQEIPYVVWKACHELQISLNGKGDIDLLVDLQYRELFKALVRAQGFLYAKFNALTFPFVEHFYGYDEETGQICHLHVYYKLITGETHIKAYHLTLENEIMGNRFLNSLNVYESSYRDQALIYSLRHYMKRASLIGFLFWAYERKDYLDEYAYICNGLTSSARSDSFPAENNLHSEFDFHRLDMGTGFSGYCNARDKVSCISGFRRFNAFEAAWKSLCNLGVRLFYKAFRVRKRPEKGLLLAVSGVDGSGKSSMVEELHGWFGRDFDVEVLHLGKPSPKFLTLPLRPLLFVYRIVKGQNRDNLDDSIDSSGVGTLKKKNGLIWAVRYVALAYERYRVASIALDLADKGKIVICDRYPSNSSGKMDSPRIGPCGSKLVEKMRSYEHQLYERVPKADGLIFLDVSREEAINRNRARIKKDKETDEVIAFRHKENQGLDFSARQVFFVDTNRDYDSVLKSLKSIAWECLLKGSNQ